MKYMKNTTTLYFIGVGVLIFLCGALIGYWVTLQEEYTPMVNIQKDMSRDTLKEMPEYTPQEREYLFSVSLPSPSLLGTLSVEQALKERRSRREYADTPLSLSELSQMLWAGQGQTTEDGKRTAPSGRNIYPITLFVAVENVEGLTQGVYEYIPETHELKMLREGSVMSEWEAITPQTYPTRASAVVFVNGNMLKPYESFGEKSRQVVAQESGHIGQNMYLQAESLSLAMLVMGGFSSDEARKILGTTEFDEVLYLIPIGHRLGE